MTDKTVVLSSRLDQISESLTLKLNALTKKMKADGIDVINLSAGETDFQPPQAAKEAIVAAMDRADGSKYTPVAGVSPLLELIASKTNQQQPSLNERNRWDASNVLVTNGGKQALFNIFLALLNSGDEVLIASPYWLSYPDMIRLAGGKPNIIRTSLENDFKIHPAQLKQVLNDRIKILVLNSPSNPTGTVYSRDELKALGEVLVSDERAQKIWVISDEIYDRITFTENLFCSFLEAVPELAGRCITVNGLSKSAAMTGWRIGWSVAPKPITSAMVKIQGQSTSGINTLAQWASIAALKLPESVFINQVQVLRKRRDLVLDILAKCDKIKLMAPEGAFYVFIDIGRCLKSGEDAVSFAEDLLKTKKLSVVPGNPFGESSFVRLSFVIDEPLLQEGCNRFVQYVQDRITK